MLRPFRIALLSMLVLLVAGQAAALAYDGEVPIQLGIEGAGRVVCPATVPLTVTVVDLNGAPQAGVQVTWSTGATGTTDADGKHTINVNVTANVTVTATAGNASASHAITCVQGQDIPLPRTDVTTPAQASPASSWWLAIVIVVAVTGTLALATRRR